MLKVIRFSFYGLFVKLKILNIMFVNYLYEIFFGFVAVF